MKTLREYYRENRTKNPTIPARWALNGARHSVQVDAILDVIEWETVFDGHLIAIGNLPNGTAIAVYNDAEPYEWGDTEPTEWERRNLEVIGCAGRIAGESEDYEPVWGCAYFDGDWEREAVSFALEYGMLQAAQDEVTERAYWAARDVLTVG